MAPALRGVAGAGLEALVEVGRRAAGARLPAALAGCALLSLASPFGAAAQVPVSLEITPQVGYLFLNGDAARDVLVNEDGVLYQMRVNVLFTPRWGVEGSSGLIFSDYLPEQAHRRSFFVAGAATYRLTNASRVTPLLSAGAEMLAMDTSATGDEASLALVWGPGLEIQVSRNAYVRIDARHHYFRVDDEREPDAGTLWLSHFDFGVGIAWRPWG